MAMRFKALRKIIAYIITFSMLALLVVVLGMASRASAHYSSFKRVAPNADWAQREFCGDGKAFGWDCNGRDDIGIYRVPSETVWIGDPERTEAETGHSWMATTGYFVIHERRPISGKERSCDIYWRSTHGRYIAYSTTPACRKNSYHRRVLEGRL